MLELPSVNPVRANIWKIQTSPKIRNFLWKALSEALPVADLIRSRGMKVDERCQLCGLEGESIQHVLFQCAAARHVWAISGIPQPRFELQEGALFSNLHYFMQLNAVKRGEASNKRAWLWICWYLWKSRNDFLFNGVRWTPEEIVRKARDESEEWLLA